MKCECIQSDRNWYVSEILTVTVKMTRMTELSVACTTGSATWILASLSTEEIMTCRGSTVNVHMCAHQYVQLIYVMYIHMQMYIIYYIVYDIHHQ